jgi:hypothetical protein
MVKDFEMMRAPWLAYQIVMPQWFLSKDSAVILDPLEPTINPLSVSG